MHLQGLTFVQRQGFLNDLEQRHDHNMTRNGLKAEKGQRIKTNHRHRFLLLQQRDRDEGKAKIFFEKMPL